MSESILAQSVWRPVRPLSIAGRRHLLVGRLGLELLEVLVLKEVSYVFVALATSYLLE